MVIRSVLAAPFYKKTMDQFSFVQSLYIGFPIDPQFLFYRGPAQALLDTNVRAVKTFSVDRIINTEERK